MTAGPRRPPREGAHRPATGWSQLEVRVAYTRMAPKLMAALAGAQGVRLGGEPADPGPDTEVLIGYHFPADSCAGLHDLRWVHLTGTGTDHLDSAGLSHDVLVTTSASVPVVAVAEYALSGLLLLAKDLVDVAANRQREWFASRATLLSGSTAGVVGAGRIGRAVLTRLAALGARTVAITRPGAPPVPEAAATAGSDRLADEAGAMDHLLACLPGRPDTEGLISAEVLAALGEGATVVNVGRASTIDTAALYAALRGGRLRGAFLDVHDVEPLPAGDEAWSVPNLVLSPHRAFSFPGEPDAVAAAFLDNLDDLRHGRRPRDRAAWPPERTAA